MTLAVVTDSAACLPPELARNHGIDVVPLHVIDDDVAPTTARPSVAELAAAYTAALNRADEVLAVHIASVLSGTIDNARLAAQELAAGGRSITVLDSVWPSWPPGRPETRAAGPPAPASARRARAHSSSSTTWPVCGAAGAWTAPPP